MPVWRIAVKSTGASSTRPTWKNTGSPMRKPDSSIAQSSRFSPSAADEDPRDDDRSARLGEELADDRSKAHDHRDEPERVADPLLKRARDVGERHARAEADEKRPGGQRNERGNPHPGDEEHDERDAEERDQQQRRGVDGGQGAGELTMIW